MLLERYLCIYVFHILSSYEFNEIMTFECRRIWIYAQLWSGRRVLTSLRRFREVFLVFSPKIVPLVVTSTPNEFMLCTYGLCNSKLLDVIAMNSTNQPTTSLVSPRPGSVRSFRDESSTVINSENSPSPVNHFEVSEPIFNGKSVKFPWIIAIFPDSVVVWVHF